MSARNCCMAPSQANPLHLSLQLILFRNVARDTRAKDHSPAHVITMLVEEPRQRL
jgi:hypothetical protein